MSERQEQALVVCDQERNVYVIPSEELARYRVEGEERAAWEARLAEEVQGYDGTVPPLPQPGQGIIAILIGLHAPIIPGR